ncbi:MAG TPA: polysaccharide deacetylase family protein, partial [Fimbriimonas sp.]|nr:polysaccharide deacetylase family protein [Fimbriimonas sp.]
YALPILIKEKIPATQFVHTGFVGSKVGRPKMDWNQLSTSIKTGLVSVGSQTVTHPADITKLKTSAIRTELIKSAETIGAELGRAAPYFAYPNGKFNSAVAGEVKRAGYRMAFTEECLPLESAKSPFLVPRYVHTKMRQAFADCKD